MYRQIAQIDKSSNLRGLPEAFTGKPSLKKVRTAFFNTLPDY